MANKQLYANNAVSSLTGAIGTGATALNVTPGEGAKFPVLPAGSTDWFLLTLLNPANNTIEIVRVTARNGDTMSIQRAQEGTVALAFPVGATVDHRMTAGTLAQLVQRTEGGAIGVPPAPANDGKQYGLKDSTWVENPAVGPAASLSTNAVAALAAAAAAGGNASNRVALVSELVQQGTLPQPILDGLAAATSPSTGNPFATLSDLSGDGEGTVLAQPIVDALNAAVAAGPATDNPFVLASQMPVSATALPSARMTMGGLRALKNGIHRFPASTTSHPVLGSIPYVDFDDILGTQLVMPVAVSAVLVKQDRAYFIVCMMIDQISFTYTSTGYLLEDDTTVGNSTNTNTSSNSKTHFKNLGILIGQQLDQTDIRLRALISRVDELQVSPDSLPTSEGNMELSLLYEPYIVLTDAVVGVDVFDATTHYVKIAWPSGGPVAAATAGKELFTVNGGVYGHLRDGLGGPFITLDRVLRWRSEDRIIQVMRDTTDANIGNLCVIQIMPKPGGTNDQALTRTAKYGLASMSAGAAASYAFFRDGGATPAGRLAYKDNLTTKYPLFEGDVAPGGGTDLRYIPTNASKNSDFTIEAGHLGELTDIDLGPTAPAGVLDITVPGDLTIPTNYAGMGWYYIRNQTGTKKVRFNLPSGGGSAVTAPPYKKAYTKSTGGGSTPIKSDPNASGIAFSTQTLALLEADDVSVFYVAFIAPRALSGIPQPFTADGLSINGTVVPWDVASAPSSGIGCHVRTLLHNYGDVGSGGATLTLFPKFTDVDATVYSNVVAIQIFAFILSDGQAGHINGAVGATNIQHFGAADNYALTVSNPSAINTRAVYLAVRRGNTGNIALTCSGATFVDEDPTGSGQNSSECRWLMAQEAGVVGANAAAVQSPAYASLATGFSFMLEPLGSGGGMELLGPNEIAENNKLVPFVYDIQRGFFKVCA